MTGAHVEPLPWPVPTPRHLRVRDWESAWVEPIMREAARLTEINPKSRFMLPRGASPKVVELGDDQVMIGMSFYPGAEYVRLPFDVTVIDLSPHPFLASLPPNAPRAVRSHYSRSVRLKYARATDIWSFLDDRKKAEQAWERYHAANERA